MSTLVKIVEALLYVFGLLAILMGVATIALATSSASADSASMRTVGTLAILYSGLPAFGLGALSLGLGAVVTSIENLRRDTILVASTKK